MINQHVSEDKWTPTFEINLVVRDYKGNDSGQRKEFITQETTRLYDFFVKNSFSPQKKKYTRAATAEEATKVLKTDTELQQMYNKKEKEINERVENGDSK